MGKIQTVYIFDSDGFFDHISCAQPDPISGELLMPPNSTLIKPDIKDGYFAKFVGENWEYISKPQTLKDCVNIGAVSHFSQTPHDIELRQIFQNLADGSETYEIRRGEDSSWIVVKKPEKTPEEMRKVEIEKRIAELKSNLSNSDYVVIKIAEGEATPEEYSEVLATRKAWRSEINELEKDL